MRNIARCRGHPGQFWAEQSAQAELIRGVRGLLNRTERIETALPAENAILLGTIDEVKKMVRPSTRQRI